MPSDAPQLEPGEELIWSGKPIAIWLAIRRAWKPLLAGIGFLIASIGYLLGPELKQLPGQTEQSLNLMIAVARVFYAAGGIIGASGVLAAMWFCLRATRTTYMLTNRRVVIVTDGPLPRRMTTRLEHLRSMEFRSRLLGPSDLVIGQVRGISLDGWGQRDEGFIAVPDAAHVEKLVNAAIERTFVTQTRGPWQ